MGAVSYPDIKVIDFINASLVPIQILSDAKPYADDYKVMWTPLLIVLDQGGGEHLRSVGFLPPDELIPFLMLGMVKVYFDNDDLADALKFQERILAEYPESAAAPEALFLHGVTLYKTTKDVGKLKGVYEEIKKRYPASDWVKKASPYRLL
jgi:hypothetical protein